MYGTAYEAGYSQSLSGFPLSGRGGAIVYNCAGKVGDKNLLEVQGWAYPLPTHPTMPAVPCRATPDNMI